MKSLLKHFWLSGIAILGLPVMTAVAAPLPAGTKLGISQGVGSSVNLLCASGSCYSMEIAPGFIIWVDFGPGTDGGFIVGKAQKCGTQDIGPSSNNNTTGELTAAWLLGSYFGTFCTDPGGEQNFFDDASCTGAGCIGKTDLKYLYMAWNGNKIPLGSSVGCTHPNCSADQLAGIFVAEYQLNPLNGGTWSLHYKQVIPSGSFTGVKFSMLVRGNIFACAGCNNTPPTAEDLFVNNYYSNFSWTPSVADADGDPLTCRIGTPPGKVSATIASNCSTGSFSFSTFVTDIFSYIANDGLADSLPGVVMIWSGPVYCGSTAKALPRLSITTTAGTPVNWDSSANAGLISGASNNCRLSLRPAVGSTSLNATSRCAGTYIPKAGFSGADKFAYGFDYFYQVSPPGHIPVETCGGTAYGIIDVTVTPAIPVNVQTSPVAVSGVSQELLAWQPAVTSSVVTPPAVCAIKTAPQNGSATVASDCSTGSYQSNPGFVGTDSFVYEASVCTDQCYRSTATVTVAVTEPPPSDPCLAQYPVTQFTQTGKQGTLTITFTGNITSHTNKEVKVCPGSSLDYVATSTKGPVICKIKNSTNPGSGMLRIRDHLKCTDKPGGKDKLQFKVKSGIVR